MISNKFTRRTMVINIPCKYHNFRVTLTMIKHDNVIDYHFNLTEELKNSNNVFVEYGFCYTIGFSGKLANNLIIKQLKREEKEAMSRASLLNPDHTYIYRLVIPYFINLTLRIYTDYIMKRGFIR